MARAQVAPLSQAGPTLAAVQQRGVLLVTISLTGKPNAMTVGYLLLGRLWDRPVMQVFVRPSRYSYTCLQAMHDYTIAVLPPERDEDLLFCGRHSGRELDKIKRRGLTPIAARHTRSPLLDEALITYECSVLHHLPVDPSDLPPTVEHGLYAEGDYHEGFVGEILAVT
ncbi:MAG: flavin reductase, partial [Armatimonadetes bacterium]|nr:flavin reductase [Armatimonadota bacterium]